MAAFNQLTYRLTSAWAKAEAALAQLAKGAGDGAAAAAAGLNKALAEISGFGKQLIQLRDLLGWGNYAVKAGVGPGTGIGPGAAHASEFVTSNAARREAMRLAGIPVSQQPVAQISTLAGRQYVYNVEGKLWAVTKQTTDRVTGHGPHWECRFG